MRTISLPSINVSLNATGRLLVLAGNHDLDAPIARTALSVVVRSDRRLCALAVRFDPIRLRQILLEKIGNDLCALDRKVPVGREADRLDRRGVGVTNDRDVARLRIERGGNSGDDRLEAVEDGRLARIEEHEIADADEDLGRALLGGY